MLTIQEIMAIIPHRYPFLLIDRILELEPGKRAVGEKLVTIGEPFFQGHFPDYPIMPGVLIVEALAQTGAVLLLSDESARGQIPLFAGIEKCRFRQQVVPGDTLTLELEVIARRGPWCKGSRSHAQWDVSISALQKLQCDRERGIEESATRGGLQVRVTPDLERPCRTSSAFHPGPRALFTPDSVCLPRRTSRASAGPRAIAPDLKRFPPRTSCAFLRLGCRQQQPVDLPTPVLRPLAPERRVHRQHV
jgi:3-hydroxyacyl-[acyl-carrier-protein] dehydratase